MQTPVVPPPGQTARLFMDDPFEIALWDTTAAQIVANLCPVMTQPSIAVEAYPSIMDMHASFAAGQADRLIYLRRKRLSAIDQIEPQRIIV